MKIPVHIKPQNKLFAVTMVVVFLISFALLGLCQLDAAAFNGTLYGSSSGVDQDLKSAVPSSLQPGEVWAGKNVTARSDVLTSGKFDVELSALGCDYETQSSENLQYDVVFVLDASSSMNGSKMTIMTAAINEAIHTLLPADDDMDGIYNRVVIVPFNSGAVHGDWTEEGDVLSIGESATAAATNIQQGLYTAKELLASARPGAVPVIILLSDGAPNRHAAYNFSSESPSWVNGIPFDAYGADNSSVYTILYAAWLKTQITGLKIYTVGYDVASSSRAQAVLNPSGGLTTGISDLLDAARTTTGVTSGIGYSDGYYAATIDNLSTLLPSLTGSITTGSPIIEDLVVTDSIPAQFDVDLTSFSLNGTALPVMTPDTEYTAASGEKVLIDATHHQVIYTIPVDALRLWIDNEGESGAVNPNTLKFGVTLNNSTTGTGTKYYTDSGCTAVFEPSFSNPFYGYVGQNTVITEGSADYTNSDAAEAGWGSPGTPVVTEPDWSCVYSKTSGNSPVVSSVTVDGVTYADGVDGADITVGPRNGHVFPVTVTQDTEVPASVRTHTEISFTFDPADGSHTGYSPLVCQYDYDARSGPDILTIDYITVNSTTYNTSANFSFTGSNGDYIVTVLDSSTEITCFDLEFPNADITDAVFTFDSPATKTVTTTLWVPASAAETQFTVADPLPAIINDPVSVTVDETAYSGTVSPFIDATHWSFTQTKTEGSITIVFTITLDGDTLTVAYVQTDTIPAHWANPVVNSDNIATLNLTETGWIILSAPPTTGTPPTDTSTTTEPPTTQPPTTQPPTAQPPTSQPPTTQPPTTDDTGVAEAHEKLPQTGGISSSTLIGLFGLALIVSGGTAVTIHKKKNDGKSK